MSFFKVTQVKACRKESKCYWCMEVIQLHAPKTTTATVWEGDFSFSSFHPECFSALEEWQTQNPLEDLWPMHGDMKRGSTEPK